MAGLNLFTNNAATTLASSITNVATSLTVAAGTGSLFPTLTGSQYFYCTLANTGGTTEIVKVTARSTDTFTIVRGQDGTSAAAWNGGDKVELRLARIDLLNFPQLDSDNTFAGANTFSGLATFSNTGVFSIGTNQFYKDASGNVGIGTASPNGIFDVNAAVPRLMMSVSGAVKGQLNIASSAMNITANDVTYPITFNTGGGERMRIDSSGNVGIGVTPSYNLHVKNSSGNCIIASQYGTGTIGQFIAAANQVDIKAFNGTNDVLTFTTGSTERMRITTNGGISFGSSGTAYGSSGQVLQSNGDAAPTWVASGSMTLLGTITVTAANSISLGSLTLTNYKSLYIVFNNVDGASTLYISGNNTQTNNNYVPRGTGSATGYGICWTDLGTGACGGTIHSGNNGGSFGNIANNVSTSTTTLYFRLDSTKTWTAQGSIVIYGVK